MTVSKYYIKTKSGEKRYYKDGKRVSEAEAEGQGYRQRKRA